MKNLFNTGSVTVKRILVVRRDNIGDLVCTTPAISALRKKFPQAVIGVLVNSYNAEVLNGNPCVDRVFVYEKLKHATSNAARVGAIFRRLKLIAVLWFWSPDFTLLAKAGYEKHGLFFAKLIRAKNIIGYAPNDLTQNATMPDIYFPAPEYARFHEVEAVARLLQPLGIDNAFGSLHVYPNPHIASAFSKRLPSASYRIALHVSAREVERRWGVDNYIGLIEHILSTRKDTQILLFWSPGRQDDPRHPGDDMLAANLLKLADAARLVPLPTESLTELIAALSICDLFIGADGGAMHLAVALNKKVLALFENLPQKLGHWYPWRVTSEVVHADAEGASVAFIGLNQVTEALAALQ